VSDPRPAALVTNVVTEYRHGAFELLAEREDVEVIAWGDTGQLDAARRVASGRYRAVICGLGGRVALPAVYLAARRARIPFILWASIWSHPRTAAHALSVLPLRWIYRHADAIVTYGPHVSDYVRAKGARGPVVEAPQSVDDAFWTAPAQPRREAPFQTMFAGRLAGEKGVAVLLEAWRDADLDEAALILAGDGPIRARVVAATGVHAAGPLAPAELRNFYAGSDVVVVPSVPTRDFLEPWGLVVNEAFHQGVPVIATDAVGAAAGGLVQHERTGLVVPAGDAAALGAALRRSHDDAPLRARLGAAAREAVAPYTQQAWAGAMSRALAVATGC
jgi:glycosyltransferase involved in cell wall biosynthesis